jgi:hypothetical protein
MNGSNKHNLNDHKTSKKFLVELLNMFSESPDCSSRNFIWIIVLVIIIIIIIIIVHLLKIMKEFKV